MANYYTNIAFDLRVTPAEANQLRTVFGFDWEDGNWDGHIVELLGPDREQAIKRLQFNDPEYPYFNVDVDIEPAPAEDGKVPVMFTAYEGPDIEALANALQICLTDSLPIGFEWANTCDKHRAGAFGGGWCAVFKDRIEYENTSTRLEIALNEGID